MKPLRVFTEEERERIVGEARARSLATGESHGWALIYTARSYGLRDNSFETVCLQIILDEQLMRESREKFREFYEKENR